MWCISFRKNHLLAMPRKNKRVFGDLDSNVIADHPKETIKLVPTSDGQENARKKPKLESTDLRKPELQGKPSKSHTKISKSAFSIPGPPGDGQENASKEPKLEPTVPRKPESQGQLSKLHPTISKSVFSIPSEESLSTELLPEEDIVKLKDPFLLTSEMIEGAIAVEMSLSGRFKLPENYCKKTDVYDPVRREILLEYLLQITGSLKVGHEVFHLSAILLDMYLSSVDVSMDKLQAVAEAAFWISHKLFNGGILAKSILKFGVISRKLLLYYERQILLKLDFNLQFTNSLTILNCLLLKVYDGQIPKVIFYTCCYFVDLMFIHIDFIRDCLSKRASAAAFTSLFLLKSSFTATLWKKFDGTTQRAVLDIHQRLINILKLIRKEETQCQRSVLYKKYASSKYRYVSKLLTTEVKLIAFDFDR